MWRARWAAVGAACAVALGAGGFGFAQAVVDSGEKPVTITIESERIVDSRTDLGVEGALENGVSQDVQVTGEVPVASGGTKTVVPADAVAVLVNVTVVRPTSPGFLTARPAGAVGEPTTSTVNFPTADSVEPNAATVDLGPGGKLQLDLVTQDESGTANVVVDVVGYTVDHNHDDRYFMKEEADGRGYFLEEVAVTFETAGCPEGEARLEVTQRDEGPIAAVYEKGQTDCVEYIQVNSETVQFRGILSLLPGVPDNDKMYRPPTPTNLGTPATTNQRFGPDWRSGISCFGDGAATCDANIFFESDPGALTNAQIQTYFDGVTETITVYGQAS